MERKISPRRPWCQIQILHQAFYYTYDVEVNNLFPKLFSWKIIFWVQWDRSMLRSQPFQWRKQTAIFSPWHADFCTHWGKIGLLFPYLFQYCSQVNTMSVVMKLFGKTTMPLNLCFTAALMICFKIKSIWDGKFQSYF